MLITHDVLTETFGGFKALYDKSFGNASPLYPLIACVVASTTDKVIAQLPDGTFVTIKNSKYEATVEVGRETLEDDTGLGIGQVKPRIEALGSRAAVFPDELVVGLLNNGFDTFFGKYDGQLNSLIGELNPNNLKIAIDTMMTFRNNANKPSEIVPNVLLVGPENYFNARRMLNDNTVQDWIRGIVREVAISGLVGLHVSPYVETGNWFLLSTQAPEKRPIVFNWQIRPMFKELFDSSDDDIVFCGEIFKYGVSGRCGAAYGSWQRAIGCKE